MAELTAKLFKEYFGGSWDCEVFRNGESIREIVVDWQGDIGNDPNSNSNAIWIRPAGINTPIEPPQIVNAGWHNDIHRWCDRWYNEFGGYGELSWSSQETVNGITVLYGTVHECEHEGDDPADYIAMCELYDQDNFKYTIQSYRKGILEIVARRSKTAEDPPALTQVRTTSIEQNRSAKTAGSASR